MPASAVAVPGAEIETPPEIRVRQMEMLEEVAARFGFDPVPNETPQEAEPEPPETVLRRHLAHVELRGSVLDPESRARRTLASFIQMDGVPLVVEEVDRYAPLLRCILCGGSKGETYTICAGCWTTQTRYLERKMLSVLPDVNEQQLAGFKPLTPDQFRRAIRRAARLEPTRYGYLQPQLEAIRRKSRAAVVLADRAARLDALQAASEEPGITPRERRIRVRLLRAALAAQPWEAKDWFRGAALLSLDGVWLAELATAEADESELEEDDGEYPVEWLACDWMHAPDRAWFIDETDGQVVSETNTAAGTDEHLEALHRNALFDAYIEARRQRWFQEGLDEYISWLVAEMNTLGGVPARLRARVPEESDDEDCERWDRWIDAILGGKPAGAPAAVEPLDAALCRRWGAGVTAAAGGAPTQLPRLDSDYQSGRLRWPQFVRAEIEEEHHAWGFELVLAEEDGPALAWCGDRPGERYRRVNLEKLLALLQKHDRETDGRPTGEAVSPADVKLSKRQVRLEIQRLRLKRWAEKGPERRPRRTRRMLRPDGTWAPCSREVRLEWTAAIRAERARRRFEAMANANAGIHATHLEADRFQNN